MKFHELPKHWQKAINSHPHGPGYAIAAQLGMSASNANYHFRKLTGQTLAEWLSNTLKRPVDLTDLEQIAKLHPLLTLTEARRAANMTYYEVHAAFRAQNTSWEKLTGLTDTERKNKRRYHTLAGEPIVIRDTWLTKPLRPFKAHKGVYGNTDARILCTIKR